MRRLFLSLKILGLSFLVLPGAQASEDSELPLLHQQLLGDWNLVLINNNWPPLLESNISVTQSGIFGNTGCNRFFASIGLLDQGFWEISPVSTTRKRCMGYEDMQERSVLDALVTGARIEFDEASDQFTVEINSHSLTYQKEY